MISAFFNVIPFSVAACHAVKKRACNQAREAFVFAFRQLADCLKANIPMLLALGYDVAVKNDILSRNSASLACVVATAASHALERYQARKEPFTMGDLERLTSGIKAFDGCTTIHDYFAVLFPPTLAHVPQLSEGATLIQKSEDLREFEEAALKMGASDSLEELHKELYREGKPYSLEDLVKILQDRSPLFKKAWEIVNRRQRVTIDERREENFWKGAPIYSRGKSAAYNSHRHLIAMSDECPIDYKIGNLIFETINALQRESFHHLERLPQKGVTTREDRALLVEEFHSFNWRARILKGRPDHPGISFGNFWKAVNKHKEPPLVSHAERIRRIWDKKEGLLYLHNHRDWFFERLNALAKS
jgi:hypothetical protein